MEDQGKRLMLAVGLSLVAVMVYSFFFAPTPQPAAPPTPEQTQPAPAASESAPVAGKSPVAPTTEPAAPTAVAGPEKLERLESGLLAVEVSSHGGALRSVRVQDRQYAENGQARDLVRGDKERGLYGAQVAFVDSDFTVPGEADWQLARTSEQRVDAVYRAEGELEVRKTFVLAPDNYTLTLAVEVTNLSDRTVTERLAVDVYTEENPHAADGGMFHFAQPRWEIGCRADGENKTSSPKDLAQPVSDANRVRWVAVVHKYFFLGLAPDPSKNEERVCTRERMNDQGLMRGRLLYPAWKLGVGDKVQRDFVIYAGPTLADAMARADAPSRGATELGEAISWGLGITKWFSFVAKPLHWVLALLHRLVGSWGVAIILLTVLVKVATLHWNTKAMKSMRAMAKLKPKVDALKEKYPADRQAQQMAIMSLYKTHNVSMLGGCLPMLLQMPIWMGLYAMIYAAGELYQAPFLWLRDLTAPDPYYIFPVALTGMMFLQNKVSPTTADAMQQKIMMYVMPLMFGGMTLFFPSGLAVYWFTNTSLQVAHYAYMGKQDREDKAREGAKDERGQGERAAAPSSEGSLERPRRKKKGRGGRRTQAG